MNYYSFMLKQHARSMAQFRCISTFIFISLFLLPVITLLRSRWAFISFTGLILYGWLAWTFTEYMVHRFRTHQESGSSAEGRFKRHMHHHKHPTEIKVTGKQRVLLLLCCTILLSVSIWLNNYFSIVAGYFIGFSYSFFSHWILHQSWSRLIFPHLHQFHIHHHCKYPDKCFGFSTTLWDHVFGTVPPKDARISERIIRFYYGEEHDH